ncbi:unnamed protein product [Porites evermanni]|uniref:Nocturnin n=1 Tax=Porites evermanni TaxID=104178 RepID=A0ABN8QG06_9CNID|nr:unnamed protein product [Porites evermanni]
MNSESPSLGRKIVYADRRNEECVDRDISLVTYNILADFYLQPARTKGNYKRCPKEYAARHQDKDCLRHKLLFTEFQWLDADIVCLQEVDPPYFNDILKGEMSLLGYQGLFAQKDKSTGRLEGIALFYKHEKFDLQEARKMIINEIADEIMPQAECREFGEVVILATLRDKITKTLLVIGNTHILWGDLLKPVTQACEIALVTQALRDKVASLKLQGESVAYILCGDFNIDPPYPAYELLNRGKLDEEHFSKLQTVDYLKFPKDFIKPQQVQLPQVLTFQNSALLCDHVR